MFIYLGFAIYGIYLGQECKEIPNIKFTSTELLKEFKKTNLYSNIFEKKEK